MLVENKLEDDPRRKESWISKLKKDELIDELAQRGLRVDGSLSVLRERLIRFERVEAERVVREVIDSGIECVNLGDATGSVTEPSGSQTTTTGDADPRAPSFPTGSSIACQTEAEEVEPSLGGQQTTMTHEWILPHDGEFSYRPPGSADHRSANLHVNSQRGNRSDYDYEGYHGRHRECRESYHRPFDPYADEIYDGHSIITRLSVASLAD